MQMDERIQTERNGFGWYPISGATKIDAIIAASIPYPNIGPDAECCICLEVFGETTEALKLSRCIPGHYYHEDCIRKLFETSTKCATCQMIYMERRGPQPPGMMRLGRHPKKLPGELGRGMYSVYYEFSDGVTSDGTPYTGTARLGFLPDGHRGMLIAAKFMRAFDLGLMFTVVQLFSALKKY